MPSRPVLAWSLVAVASVLPLVVSGLAVAPASAETAGHTSWTARAEGVSPAADVTRTWVGDESTTVRADLDRRHYYTYPAGADDGRSEVLRVYAYGAVDGLDLALDAPQGAAFQAGRTYRVSAVEATKDVGRLWLGRSRTMCGEQEEQWEGYLGQGQNPPAAGSVTIHELVRDASGGLERLSLSYDLACQVIGAGRGYVGSVAVNASAPAAAVPAPEALPGAVSDLRVVNVGPGRDEDSTTTLTWRPAPGSADSTVEYIQTTTPSEVPPMVGFRGRVGVSSPSYISYRGTGSRHSMRVQGIAGVTWRVTPRSASGRLGPSTLLVVRGTRISTDYRGVRSTVGQSTTVRGRVSDAWDYVEPGDVMKGPAVVGKRVRLCPVVVGDGPSKPCVASTLTNDEGRFALTVVPEANTDYQVVTASEPDRVGTMSYAVSVMVTPFTDLAVAGHPAGRSAATRFTTSRARSAAKGTAQLQRLVGSRWRPVATKTLGSGRGRLAFTVRGARPGQHYRVVKPAQRRYTTGVSRVVRLR